MVESWRATWRRGVAPLLDERQLLCLLKGLRRDDPALVQGSTTVPPPLQVVKDWPAEACCVLAYVGWRCHGGIVGTEDYERAAGEGPLETVGETEDAFAATCFAIDQRLGEPAGCRHFLNWYDETPRMEMITELLAEVELTLSQRKSNEGTAS